MFAESIRVKQLAMDACSASVASAADRLIACFEAGNKALLFGNGGSASDAQHIAAEWVGRLTRDRPALPAIALGANGSELSAIANDDGFGRVFARMIEAHGRPGDVAIALSTSGNSENVVAGAEAARHLGLFTVALSGMNGGKLAGAVDLEIRVPSHDTQRIQETHITIGHILCQLVEDAIFPLESPT